MTLGQAQTHLHASSVGSRIALIQDDPIHFLKTTNEHYDYAIFFHSIWYFSGSDEVEQIFRVLYSRVRTLCIAEYTLHGSTSHLLAILIQAACDTRSRLTSNVRTVLSKRAIIELACKAGWTKIEIEFEVNSELDDGKWEVQAALDLVEKQERTELTCVLKYALLESLEQVDNLKEIRTLNVWSSILSHE